MTVRGLLVEVRARDRRFQARQLSFEIGDPGRQPFEFFLLAVGQPRARCPARTGGAPPVPTSPPVRAARWRPAAAGASRRSRRGTPPSGPSPSNTSVLVTTLFRNRRSWLTTSSVPRKRASSASTSSSVSMIEIVRRLVEDQHIGRLRQQPCEQQAVAFTARQGPDGRSRALGREQEVLEVAVHVARDAADRHGVVAVGDRVDDGPIGIELLAVLIEVRDLHVRAVLALRPRRAPASPTSNRKQRRLAGAVRSDEPDAIAADDAGREAFHDRLAAVGLRDVGRPRTRRGPIARPHRHAAARSRTSSAARGALLPHRQQGAHASFVAGAPRLHAAPEPGFFLREALVELLVRERLAREPGLFLFMKVA